MRNSPLRLRLSCHLHDDASDGSLLLTSVVRCFAAGTETIEETYPMVRAAIADRIDKHRVLVKGSQVRSHNNARQNCCLA